MKRSRSAICKGCGTHFQQDVTPGRPRQYCDTCRRTSAARRREERKAKGLCVLCGRPRQPDDPLYCPSHRTMKRQSEWRRRNADLLLDLDEVFRQLNLPDVPQAVRRIRGGYRNARIRDAASTYRMLSQSLQQIVDELVADDPMRFIFSTLRSFIEDGPGEEIQDYPGGE